MSTHELKIYNSLAREKSVFIPQDGRNVSLYVCGITPYDAAHVGHGRCYVHFDVVYRTLKYLGYNVTYVRNVTDIDDKIIKKATPPRLSRLDRESTPSLEAIAHVVQTHFEAFEKDMARLNALQPDEQPRVSTSVPEIIAFIETLLERGHAYPLGYDVYFDSASYASYGKLSGKNLDELQAGARIAVSDGKRNTGDFVLWKGNSDGDYWQAPWGGHGRPGWHIECSTFIKEVLGNTIDIHGGGIDLIFPHHENERAQSECATGETFVRYWMHNAHVTLHKEKMSKSSGNFFTLGDVFKEFDPMVVRFYLLQHHYRTPLDFSYETLAASQKAYKKLCKALAKKGMDPGSESGMTGSSHVMHNADTPPLKLFRTGRASSSYLQPLLDDFNTPKLIGLIFADLKKIQSDEQLCNEVRSFLQDVLGLTCEELVGEAAVINDDVTALIAQRAEARAAKNWAEADRIRDLLREMGHDIVDKK